MAAGVVVSVIVGTAYGLLTRSLEAGICFAVGGATYAGGYTFLRRPGQSTPVWPTVLMTLIVGAVPSQWVTHRH